MELTKQVFVTEVIVGGTEVGVDVNDKTNIVTHVGVAWTDQTNILTEVVVGGTEVGVGGTAQTSVVTGRSGWN